MGIGFKGGLAAFVKGAQQGEDRMREMELQDRNNAWIESQRKETAAKQARDEATRLQMKDVGKDRLEEAPQYGPGQESPSGAELPMPSMQIKRKATQSEALGDLATVRRNAGDGEGYLNASQAAATSVDASRKKFEVDLADAVSQGDPDRITEVINSVGKNRVTGQVAITPFEREVPGYGKIPTFNATFKVQDPSGKMVEQTVNSHDLQMRAQPYGNQLSTVLAGRKQDREDRATDATTRYRDALGSAAQVRAEAAGNKPEKMDEERKLEYKRLDDEHKSISNEITKSRGKGDVDENSPGMLALKNQKAQLAVKLRLMSSSSPDASGDPYGFRASPPGAAASSNGVVDRSKNPLAARERDADQRFIITKDVGEAQARVNAHGPGADPEQVARDKSDLASLQRELSRLPGSKVKAPPAAPIEETPVMPAAATKSAALVSPAATPATQPSKLAIKLGLPIPADAPVAGLDDRVKKAAEQKATEMLARVEREKQATNEKQKAIKSTAWLTADRIAVMTPKEAQNTLSKYGSTIDAEMASLLRRKL